MSVGNKPAFPSPPAEVSIGGDLYPHEGMTYRQWLIGLAISGIAQRTTVPHLAAQYAIDLADSVITRLDAEQDGDK
ncbi:MAG: hypothetical protein F6J87_30030 [Spirulina sp. SIO3F2]|nr:hypothetical protein [Spirulina sp. SIO3F2]